MSSTKKNNNGVETVLPASGSGSPANTDQQQDPKSYKQELKNRINGLKAQIKDNQKNIGAAQKELNKLSKKPKKVAVIAPTKIVKKKLSKNKK